MTTLCQECSNLFSSDSKTKSCVRECERDVCDECMVPRECGLCGTEENWSCDSHVRCVERCRECQFVACGDCYGRDTDGEVVWFFAACAECSKVVCDECKQTHMMECPTCGDEFCVECADSHVDLATSGQTVLSQA